MPIRAESVRALLSVRAAIEAAASLAVALRLAADQIHKEDGLTAAQRDLVGHLLDSGPRTVPDVARARGVTRQSVQTMVNALATRGLVASAANPRHRRSARIELTPAGRSTAHEIRRREGLVAAGLVPDLDAADLDRAAETLRRLRSLVATRTGTGRAET
ncbi:MAG TPA: helix-turn-helix domain-containing protein [Vicinamibacterales bacterium]|nr:helix-turn-helix domain-containing protein [Vicinamibacterales bacterium]